MTECLASQLSTFPFLHVLYSGGWDGDGKAPDSEKGGEIVLSDSSSDSTMIAHSGIQTGVRLERILSFHAIQILLIAHPS